MMITILTYQKGSCFIEHHVIHTNITICLTLRMSEAVQDYTSTLSKPLQDCLPLALERVLLKSAVIPNQILQLSSVWANVLKV